MTVDLDGLPAVVTGSSRGLGRAFADALAAAGARVVVNGTDPATADAAAKAIEDRGGTAVAVAGSVADADFCAELVDACVTAFGGIGLLVNNAGVVRDRTLMRMSAAEFDEVVAVHLRGTWACGAAAARAMRAHGGAIVNITSGAGLYATFGQANYAAAKAGIVGLTRAMHRELARYAIRVNAVAPVARTDMTAFFDSGPGTHALTFPPPETVSPLIVHLAADRSPHLSGQVLSFDGTQLSVWTHPEAALVVDRPEWTTTDFARALDPDAMQPFHPDRWGRGVATG